MTHLFLTGEVQVGKSTLIRRLLLAHPEWRIGGFRTVTRWEGKRGTVHILPAGADMAACTEENCVGLRNLTLMRPVGYPDVFDRVGTPLLCEQGVCDLLLMDELGMMERDAQCFCDAVLRALDGNVPVLGVVKPRSSELLDAVRAHSGVKTVTVTRENRDALFDSLDALLCEMRR